MSQSITISGVEIPTPGSCAVNIYDETESRRNAKGDLIAEKLNTKRKIELTWKYLSKEEVSTLLSIVMAGFFYTVVYPDPATGNDRTGTFYRGDISAPSLYWNNGTITYKDVKFNLIER